MLEMRSAIPHHPLPPPEPVYSDVREEDISLILSEVQIEAAEDLDALGELEWKDDMCDGTDVNEDTDSGDEADERSFAHSHLVILPGGVGTCFEASQMPPGRFSYLYLVTSD